MDVNEYCGSMMKELNDWKSKINNALQKTNTLSANEKKIAAPLIGNMQSILNELVNRVDQLESRCPVDWSADKKEIESRLFDMKEKWDEIWGMESTARPLI